jgi:hypothetical protein
MPRCASAPASIVVLYPKGKNKINENARIEAKRAYQFSCKHAVLLLESPEFDHFQEVAWVAYYQHKEILCLLLQKVVSGNLRLGH